MNAPIPIRLAVLLALTLMLAACAGSAAVAPTPLAPEDTPVPAETPTATVPPSPTPEPLPPGLQFEPSELQQGGFVTVYLNEPATSATLTFGGKQYPMLNSNGRWWALIGVGAMTATGQAPVTATYTASGQQMSTEASITISDREFPIEYIDLDSSTAALLAPSIVQAELDQRAAIYSSYTPERLWSGPLQRPAQGAVTSTYGEARSYNGAPPTDYHRGTDFGGGAGAPVFASATGRVVFSGPLQVRGNTVILDHGAGLFTAYHHLSAAYVSEGELVPAGTQIGAIGSTGLATGPHLHWEVIIRGVEVDGSLWLQGAEAGP